MNHDDFCCPRRSNIIINVILVGFNSFKTPVPDVFDTITLILV